MSNENDKNHLDEQLGELVQADSAIMPDYAYIMEELNVLHSKVGDLEQDRELLYNITQQQKDRITELSNKINALHKSLTLLTYGGVVIVTCFLLLASYYVF